MTQNFRFGVELEFAVAFLCDSESKLLPEDAEGKTVRFLPANEAESRHVSERKSLSEIYIWHHIKETLNNIGLDHLVKIEGDKTEWSIGDDPSVKGPKDGELLICGMELRFEVPLFHLILEV